MRWTRLRKVLGLGVLPTLLLLGALEAGTRLVSACASGSVRPLYYGAPELHRVLFESKGDIVKRQGTFFHEPYRLDPRTMDLTQGMVVRGRYYPFAKPPGTRRLLVFGASSLLGVTTPDEWAFPAFLERHLNSRGGSVRYEVLNMGVSGVDSAYLRQIRQPEALQFEHDVELFYALHNDLFKPVIAGSHQAAAVQTLHNVLYRLSAWYAASHRGLLRLRGRETSTETAERILQAYRGNLEAMIQAAQARGIDVILVKQAIDFDYISTTDGWYRIFVDAYRRALASLDELGAAYGVEVLDAAGPLYFTQGPAQLKAWFYDEVHLTAEGHAALAQLILDQLLERRPAWLSEGPSG